MTDSEKIALEDCISNNPLVLLSNDTWMEEANKYLPYSTGFEIECNYGETFDVKNFMTIPNILDVNCDSMEQRFRIPNGTAGLICLYLICEKLKENSTLNRDSGIHYHVDLTDCFKEIQSKILSQKDWVLKELESWEYKGTYNSKTITNGGGFAWVRLNSLQTIEFRIGEMSFDYKVLVKRILHCNSIVRKIKKNLLAHTYLPIVPSSYPKVNKERLLSHISYKNSSKIIELEEKLKTLNEKYDSITMELSDIKEIVNKRVIQI